jgi:hypothetical protein
MANSYPQGKKVMLDRDLAELYGVTTGNLNKAVKRNIERFPDDFMFQLSSDELKNMIFQLGRSSWGGTRKLPLVFTENGVDMLSGVLNSPRAVQVNIQIMRAFTQLRGIIMENKEIYMAIQNIEKRLNSHDRQIQLAFATLQSLLTSKPEITKKPYSPDGKKQMGFAKE